MRDPHIISGILLNEAILGFQGTAAEQKRCREMELVYETVARETMMM